MWRPIEVTSFGNQFLRKISQIRAICLFFFLFIISSYTVTSFLNLFFNHIIFFSTYLMNSLLLIKSREILFKLKTFDVVHVVYVHLK